MEKYIFYIKSIIYFLLEILFPSRCICCDTKNFILCQECIYNLKRDAKETEENIFALYDYQDPFIKNIIWKLKYHHSPFLGRKLGEIMYSEMIEEIHSLKIFSLGSPIYVIPIPISFDRKKHRGYNQSEIIARSFCKSGDKNIFQIKTNIILKKKNTIPQARLTNRKKRLQNIKETFDIDQIKLVKNKTIIIIDDVTTTGGTILEVMKMLKKHGAKKIVGFVFAH